eukprot:Hpha_TRINITY_DN34631_c0_g1::TRINITY_DN34631_c0_g1_i1::g.20980::m.20980
MALVASAYAKNKYQPILGLPGIAPGGGPQLADASGSDAFIRREAELWEAEWSAWEVLGLLPGSTAEECVRAYKRLSLRWHPDRNLGKLELAERRFKAVSEAYRCLVDPGPPPTLRPQPEPFVLPALPQYMMMEGMHKSVEKVTFPVTLDELYRGAVKRREIKRGRCVAGDMEYETKMIDLTINPGWHHKTRLVYRNEGNQVSGGQPADLVFELEMKPDVVYRRAR